MNEEQNMPDESWRRAFDEAAETPPPRVWDAIERQLDESGGGRVVPLWGSGLSRPVVWSMGLAATVAVLLVGLWLVHSQPAARPAVARVQSAETKQPLASALTEQAAAPDGAVVKPTSAPHTKLRVNVPVAANEPVAIASAFSAERSPEKQPGYAEQKITSLLPATLTHSVLAGSVARPMAAFLTNTAATISSTGELAVSALLEPDLLTSRSVRLYEIRPLQRIVWFAPVQAEPVEPAEDKLRVTVKTKWASVSVMPGLFNPGVSVAVPAYANALAYSNTSVKTSNTPSVVSSRGRVAVAVQATAGVQLTDRWSVESGVGYFVGRSTVESPGAQPVYNFAQSGFVSSNASAAAATGNLYADLLRSQTGKVAANRNAAAFADLLISNTNQYANLGISRYADRQTVSNDYTYVQVPLQVGYELRPRKRLTLALLGGLITNIFVKNTVDDALVVKAGDGIYEPVALVASMGARFRYRSSERWSASVAGVYQPAITSSTRPDSPIQTQPTTTGVTVGVDYHF